MTNCQCKFDPLKHESKQIQKDIVIFRPLNNFDDPLLIITFIFQLRVIKTMSVPFNSPCQKVNPLESSLSANTAVTFDVFAEILHVEDLTSGQIQSALFHILENLGRFLT